MAREKNFSPISKAGVSEDSVSDTDGLKNCDGLVDLGYRKHDRVKHGAHEFANGACSYQRN